METQPSALELEEDWTSLDWTAGRIMSASGILLVSAVILICTRLMSIHCQREQQPTATSGQNFATSPSEHGGDPAEPVMEQSLSDPLFIEI